jgi:hypothetical protein
MTEVDKSDTIEGNETPVRSKTIIRISKIIMFSWGVFIGILILNPFGFALTFYHFLALALISFFVIIFYNGINPKKPRTIETVEVTNFVKMK